MRVNYDLTKNFVHYLQTFKLIKMTEKFTDLLPPDTLDNGI